VQLGVERLALGVVPVLVDPAERHVVGPALRQRGVVEGLDDVAHVAAGTGTSSPRPPARRGPAARGEVLEDELQQVGVALAAVVADEARGELAEVLEAARIPRAGDERGLVQAGGLEQAQHDDAAEQGICGLFLGVAAEALPCHFAVAVLSDLLLGQCTELLVDPALEAAPAFAGDLVEAGFRGVDRQEIGLFGLAVQPFEQVRTQGSWRTAPSWPRETSSWQESQCGTDALMEGSEVLRAELEEAIVVTR
jgi:hypothetical protein